jgi:hypothetical protein
LTGYYRGGGPVAEQQRAWSFPLNQTRTPRHGYEFP